MTQTIEKSNLETKVKKLEKENMDLASNHNEEVLIKEQKDTKLAKNTQAQNSKKSLNENPSLAKLRAWF